MAPHILLPSSRSVSPCPALAVADTTLAKRVTGTAAAAADVTVVAAEKRKAEAASEGSAGGKRDAASAIAGATTAAEATKELTTVHGAAPGAAELCAMANGQKQHFETTLAVPRRQEKNAMASVQQQQSNADESLSNSRSAADTATESAAQAAAADSRTTATTCGSNSVSSCSTTGNQIPRGIAAADASVNNMAAAPPEASSYTAVTTTVSSAAAAAVAASPARVDRAASIGSAAAAPLPAAASASRRLRRPVLAAHQGDMTAGAAAARAAGVCTKAAAAEQTATASSAGKRGAAAGEREPAAGERKTTVSEREAAAGDVILAEALLLKGYQISDDVEGEDDLFFPVDAGVSSNNETDASPDCIETAPSQPCCPDSANGNITRERSSSTMGSNSAKNSNTHASRQRTGGDAAAGRTATLRECEGGEVPGGGVDMRENEETAARAAGRMASPHLGCSSPPGDDRRATTTRSTGISAATAAVKGKETDAAGRRAKLDENTWPSLGVAGVSWNQRKPQQQLSDSAGKNLFARKKEAEAGGKEAVNAAFRKNVRTAPPLRPTVSSCSTSADVSAADTRGPGSRRCSPAATEAGAAGRGGEKLQGQQQRQQWGGDRSTGSSSSSSGTERQFSKRKQAAANDRYETTASRAQTAASQFGRNAFPAGDGRSAGHAYGARQQRQMRQQLNWRQQQQQKQPQQQQRNQQQQKQKQQRGGWQNSRSTAPVGEILEKTAGRAEGKGAGAAAAEAPAARAGGGGGSIVLRAVESECVVFSPASVRPAATRSSAHAPAGRDEGSAAATAARRSELCRSPTAASLVSVLPSTVSSTSATVAAAPMAKDSKRSRETGDGAAEGDSNKTDPAAAADAKAAAAAVERSTAAAAAKTAVIAEGKQEAALTAVAGADPAAAPATASEEASGAGVVHRAPPGLAGPDLHTALLRAAFLGRTDIMAACLQRGADVSFCDRVGRSALHYAAATGAESGLKLLLDAGADKDVNKRDHKFWTPLLIAVTKTHLACTRLLLQHGARVDLLLCHRCAPCRSSSSNTFTQRRTHSHTVPPDSADNLVAALEKGERKAIGTAAAGLMKTSAEEFTIAAAARRRSSETSADAPAAAQPACPSSSETASVQQEEKKQSQEGKQLQQEWNKQQQERKETEADDERKSETSHAETSSVGKDAEEGDTSFHKATGAEEIHPAEAPPAQTWSSAIHFAAIKGSIEISRLLVAHGATVDDLDSDNRPPLHYAACRGNTLYVKWLLDQGACVDLLDVNRRSALHAAALKGQLQNAETLLGAATDHATAFFLLTKKDIWDISPTQLAQLHGHKGLYLLLKSYTEEMEETIGAKEAARLLQQQQLPGASPSEPKQLNETIVEVLSTGLREEKRSKLERAVGRLGTMICLKAYHKTMLIQEDGGRFVADGSRKKTAGGVFFDLLKEMSRGGEVSREDLVYIEMEDGEMRRAQRRRAQQQLLQQQQKQQQRRSGGGDSAPVAAAAGGLTHAAAQPKKQQQHEHQLLQALPFAGFPPVASTSPRPGATAATHAVCTVQASSSAGAAPAAPAAVPNSSSSNTRRGSGQWKPQQHQQQRQVPPQRAATAATAQRGGGRGRGRRGFGGQGMQQESSASFQRNLETHGYRPAAHAAAVAGKRRTSAVSWTGGGEAAAAAVAAPTVLYAQQQATVPANAADHAAASNAAAAAANAAAAAMYPFQMYSLMPFWPFGMPFSIPLAPAAAAANPAGAAANPAAVAAALPAAAARMQQLPLSFAALPTSHASDRTAATADSHATAAARPAPSAGSCLAANAAQPTAAASAGVGNATTFSSGLDLSLPRAFATATALSMQQLLLQQHLFQAATAWGTEHAAAGAINDGSSNNARTSLLLNADVTQEKQQDLRCGDVRGIATQQKKQQHKQQKSQQQQQQGWNWNFAVGVRTAAGSTAAVAEEEEAPGGLVSCGTDARDFSRLSQRQLRSCSGGSYRNTSRSSRAIAAPRGRQTGGRGGGGVGKDFRGKDARRPSTAAQTGI